MRKSLLRFLVIASAIFTMAATVDCKAAVREFGKDTLVKDTTWDGEILVTGDVHVKEGVTLTIAPGSVVRFKKNPLKSNRNLFGVESPYYEQSEIIVTGRLVAKGTSEKPILFTSAETNPKTADWSALNFLGSKGNVVENCRIEYAYNGIHAHGAEVLIKNNIFVKNAVAISVKKEDEAKGTPGFGIPADIMVTGNLIEDNKGGINVRVSRAVITHNTIRDNKFFGIWIKGQCPGEISGNEITANQKGIFFYKAGTISIKGNNINDNIDYNLAIADGQLNDLIAIGNWFGTTDKDRIEALIFDQKFDPTVAKILIEPFLAERVMDAGR